MAEIAVSNETVSRFSRKTRDGRTLRYEMSILQQPQRARACGAGAKSSADRRPVDPPPVIELKIFDGEHDITFQHNASFFLYTTLEAARPIATPKGSAIPPQHPVLTGTPVAGMAYLDRPCHAGYFIFPDLSVRHEGIYKLSFNLYEEVKLESDMDFLAIDNMQQDPSMMLHRTQMNPSNKSVNFRLEVKSEAFSVFSAKKFPGLTESTQLSRVVAEQGCRVRIRRDVRVRVRKDTKATNDDDEYTGAASEGTPYERYATPSSVDHTAILERARSVNNSSAMAGNMQQYPAIEAKVSGYDQGYIKQSPYMHQASYIPQPATTYQSQTFNELGQPYQLAQSMPTHAPYHGTYHQPQQQSIHQGHSRQTSTSSMHEFYPVRRIQQSGSHIMPAPEPNPYTVLIDPTTLPRAASPANNSILPPLKSLQPMMVASPATYDAPAAFPSPLATTTNKRGYGTVFSDPRANTAVQYGARPEASGEDLPQIETEEYGLMSEDQMASMKNMLLYKRADGTRHYKKIPMA